MKFGKTLRMRTKMKHIKRSLYGIIIFAVGWVIGLLVKDWNWFQYDSSFNLFELFYCIVTLFISLYIANVIENVLQNKRSQKDIIIKKIEEVDGALVELLALFSYEKDNNRYSISNFHILSKAKQISQLAQRFHKTIKHYYPDLLNDINYECIKTRKLVNICTKLPSTQQDNIKCVDDTWFYSQDKFVDIQKEINHLRDLCFNDILKLNEQ